MIFFLQQGLFIFIYFILLLYEYSCLHFLPLLPPTPTIPTSYPLSYPPLASYFNEYAITVVPICHPLPLLHPALPTHSGNSHHCSCPCFMYISSLSTTFPILYFTSPWLFCNYLFVLLNLFTSSPILPLPLPIWHPSKHSPCP